MVSEEEDGVVRVPAEGAVLPSVGSIVHIVRALGGRVVGRAVEKERQNVSPKASKKIQFFFSFSLNLIWGKFDIYEVSLLKLKFIFFLALPSGSQVVHGTGNSRVLDGSKE